MSPFEQAETSTQLQRQQESDDFEKRNASASDAIESAAKSVLLGFVDLRLAFVFPRDDTKYERDGAFP